MKRILIVLLAAFLLFTYIGSDAYAEGNTVVRIAAPLSPHGEILQHVSEELSSLGYEIDNAGYVELVLLNPILSAHELEATFFQALPSLEMYNPIAAESEKLILAFPVFYAPFGLYAGKAKTLTDIGDGDIILIPEDSIEQSRALLLLAYAGLIDIPEDIKFEHIMLDAISAGALKLDIRTSGNTSDAGAIVMSAEAAHEAMLNPSADALFLEHAGSPGAQRFAEYIVVRSADIDADFTLALKKRC